MIRVRVKGIDDATTAIQDVAETSVAAIKQGLKLGLTPLRARIRALFGQMPAGAIKTRVDAGWTRDRASVWTGLNPIPTSKMGTVRPSGTGATVGGRFYGGGFINPHRPGVWKRKGRKRYPISMVSEPVEHLAPSVLALADGYVDGVIRQVAQE